MAKGRHAFSLEMKSRDYLKHITVSDDARDRTLIEGELGDIIGLHMVEGMMLEIVCSNGALRLDITSDEFTCCCKADSLVNPQPDLGATTGETDVS